MTRELPYDDDADTGDHANDAAYRVATGVARVARAGAYVTGGALIASNGAPAPQNESHNSRIANWSTADPHPDVPSPVVTYPDPSPDSVPPDLSGSAPAAPAPSSVLPEYFGTDAFPGFQWSFTEGGQPPAVGEMPGAPDGSGGATPYWNPGSDEYFPGSGTTMGPQFGGGQPFPMPGMHPAGAPVTSGPADAERSSGWPGGADTGHSAATLPGQGLGLPGTNGLHIPGMNGFGPGGFGSGGIESGDGLSGAQIADGQGAEFDGIGDGAGFGVFLDFDTELDAHIGPDGFWVTAESSVHLTVGDVGDQLDNFVPWMGAGSEQDPGALGRTGESPWPGHNGNPAAEPVLGQNVAADRAAIAATGAASGQSGAAHTAAAPGSSGAVAVQPASIPTAAAPVAPSFAPAQSAAPMVNMPAPQPVSPAPVVATPAVPVPVTPPAPAFAPVAATPLQTTIQPEAAGHPIANVISTHPGPSPLTAPALALPALFDDHPLPIGSDIRLPGHDSLPGQDISDSVGSHSGPATTRPPHTGTTPDSGAGHTSTAPTGHSSPSSTSGQGSTLPGHLPGHQSTGHTTPTVTPPRETDSGPTRTPGTTPSDSDARPGHVTPPETTAADPTTPDHTGPHGPGMHTGADTSATGDADDPTMPTRTPQLPDPDSTPTQHSTPPTHSQSLPTDEPTIPTHEPTVPTHEPTVPTQQPTMPTQHTVDPAPGGAGTPRYTAQVEPPTVPKPPTIDPAPNVHVPVKPAAHVTDSQDTSLWPDSDHGIAATQLGGGLHETAVALSQHGPFDPVAAVHPAFDFHIPL